MDTSQLLSRIEELETENAILKQKQIETSQAKELYLKIFEEFPALIWRSRLDKLCDYFNKTWYGFTGRSVEQEFGNGWAEGVHPDDFDNCLKIYVEAFDKREAFVMEYRLMDKYQRYRWIRDFGRPFYDLDNTFLGYIGSCYDITDPKENELKLAELNATKDKFFSIIAHDLKNPFGALLCFSEFMLDAIENNDKKRLNQCAKNISDVVNNTFRLLENLLEWSQLQKGVLNPNIQRYLLSDVLNEVVLLYEQTAKAKEIKLDIKKVDDAKVLCDNNMLKTVFRNLISNAIKFTPRKGVVTVSVLSKENFIEIQVSDNGIGIEHNKLSSIFSVAQNNSTVGTENEKGTGLGLILCKELIQIQQGNIWVESELGKGSTFYVCIPISVD